MKDRIKLFVMDVDGTLTDGTIYIGINGEVMKGFNVKDGYGLKMLLEAGIEPVILTARSSSILEFRCKELGVQELYQSVEKKFEALQFLCEKFNCGMENIAFIGDDINDLDCVRECGIGGCPNDAISEVREEADFISLNPGGRGAVRDFIDYILKDFNRRPAMKSKP